MEQKPHRAYEITKSKQKQNQYVTFILTTRSIVRLTPQIMQWYY